MGHNIGRCSLEQAELWVIYDGLREAWDAKWNKVLIETDCALAIKKIKEGVKGKSNRDLILRMQELWKREWNVEIKQISKEVNFAPHILVGFWRIFPLASKCSMQLLHWMQIKQSQTDEAWCTILLLLIFCNWLFFHFVTKKNLS